MNPTKAGLPACPVSKIQPASSTRALAACESALVGQGHFWRGVVPTGRR